MRFDVKSEYHAYLDTEDDVYRISIFAEPELIKEFNYVNSIETSVS